MIIARIALLLVLLLFSCACGVTEDFTIIEAEPEILIGDLKSYSSPEVVARALGHPSWKVTEQSGLPATDKRPPFNILSVVVAPYQDRGHSGELHITFFNSRLVLTAFYPRDPGAYRATLGAFPARDVLGGELRPKHLRVWHAVDYKEKEYFLWGDDRLMKQQSRWIERYAWMPPNPPLEAATYGRACTAAL